MSDLYELIRSTGILPAEGQSFMMDDKVHRFRIYGEKTIRASGSYQLFQRPDGKIIGWVRDHRQALTVTVTSKAARPMSAAEHQKMLADRAAKVAEKEAVQFETAVRARKIYMGGRDNIKHPYAERKGVPIVGARVIRDLLLVPAYDYQTDNKICNVQCINPDGEKRFLTNGKKTGCMGAIPPRQGNGINTIYVVEGWATGVSVWLATGCAISIAFDCGNLISVVEVLRGKHPASKIVIAGDNDQWTAKPDGTPFNPGRAFAELAKPNRILLPDFAADHPLRLTDWNDYHKVHGLDSLKERFLV